MGEQEEFVRGFRDGYESRLPDTKLFDWKVYLDGYAVGSIARDTERAKEVRDDEV